MSRLLIDTNIYSLAMRGDQEIVDILRHTRRIGISALSIGELFSGFRRGNREQVNRQELFQFLDSARVSIYPVEVETADHYSSVLHQLRRQGTPIPTNALWIAAIALQHGLPLLTRDEHFTRVAGLLLR